MSAAGQMATHMKPMLPVLQPGTTLRQTLSRKLLSLDEALAMVVPLCLDLKNRHARGEKVFVHPSCIVAGPDGFACIDPSLASAPSDPLDKACIAPENMKTKAPGNSRASVYSIGAILNEAVTGHTGGPGMART